MDLDRIKAVVFDLDNTLVTSGMDFQALRGVIGCPLNEDLLTYSDSLSNKQDRDRAHQIILDHEMSDALSSEPMSGCYELLEFLYKNNFHTAVVTRNCRQATALKLSHNNIEFEQVITREDFPAKPAPDSLVALANGWNLSTVNVLYVGDYLYDLQAAANANMTSCLVTHGQTPNFADQASLVVNELDELLTLLRCG
ncbi:HAD family hydrolase [Vibrio sp. F74]|uniref:HAD family hydrolase n=1 Tax=Vibrio sp. F74 TaxID=700020 RepID=UPI0035F583BB